MKICIDLSEKESIEKLRKSLYSLLSQNYEEIFEILKREKKYKAKFAYFSFFLHKEERLAQDLEFRSDLSLFIFANLEELISNFELEESKNDSFQAIFSAFQNALLAFNSKFRAILALEIEFKS